MRPGSIFRSRPAVQESVHLASFPVLPQEYDNRGDCRALGHVCCRCGTGCSKAWRKRAPQSRSAMPLRPAWRCGPRESCIILLQEYEQELADLFIVSQVNLEQKEGGGDASFENLVADCEVEITAAAGEKCGRCWKYSHPGRRERGTPCNLRAVRSSARLRRRDRRVKKYLFIISIIVAVVALDQLTKLAICRTPAAAPSDRSCPQFFSHRSCQESGHRVRPFNRGWKPLPGSHADSYFRRGGLYHYLFSLADKRRLAPAAALLFPAAGRCCRQSD